MPWVDSEICTGCGDCVEECPSGAIVLENDKAFIFLMDYPNRRRVKIWGRAQYVEGKSEMLERVADPEYDAKPERAVVFHITAWDSNCPQHITPRFTRAQIEHLIEGLQRENEALRRRIAN